MKVLLLALALALVAVGGAFAYTLIESRIDNFAVIIDHDGFGNTRVQATGKAFNGITDSRPISLNLTSKLTANQLNTAASAYNVALGALGTAQQIPTPTPTSTP